MSSSAPLSSSIRSRVALACSGVPETRAPRNRCRAGPVRPSAQLSGRGRDARSQRWVCGRRARTPRCARGGTVPYHAEPLRPSLRWPHVEWWVDRKSTRLNSSHVSISYAVFCLKKNNEHVARAVLQGRGAAVLRGGVYATVDARRGVIRSE